MEVEEKYVQTDRVRVGIGIPEHDDVLRRHGVERIVHTHKLDQFLEDADLGMYFRTGDVIVLAQPNLLTIVQLKTLGDQGVKFLVPGYEPTLARNDEERRLLRALKPMGEDVVRYETRGAPAKYPQPSKEQLALIVDRWHSDAKRAAVVESVCELMGAEVPMSWVRDQVKKATGSPARKPNK